jgi:hypothetical protein
MTKTITLIILLLQLNNCFSQTFDKIILTNPQGSKYFVYKYNDYNVLFSYSSFMETFKSGGNNCADTIYGEYRVMKKLLDSHFKVNDRLNPNTYIDITSKRFLDTLLAEYTSSCINKTVLAIEHDKTQSMETFMYHSTNKTENPKEHETKTFENYLFSDKKTCLKCIIISHIHQ